MDDLELGSPNPKGRKTLKIREKLKDVSVAQQDRASAS